MTTGNCEQIERVRAQRARRFQFPGPHAGVAGEARFAGEALLLKLTVHAYSGGTNTR